jgi:hypothetical protein
LAGEIHTAFGELASEPTDHRHVHRLGKRRASRTHECKLGSGSVDGLLLTAFLSGAHVQLPNDIIQGRCSAAWHHGGTRSWRSDFAATKDIGCFGLLSSGTPLIERFDHAI